MISFPPLRHALLFSLVAFALTASNARAQEDDAPIPYTDQESPPPTDDQGLRELPRHSDSSGDLREESELEEQGDQLLYRLDDPNLGVGGSFLGGALLLDSAAARGVEARFAWGLRFTWEFGRLIPQDPFHEALFADVSWMYGAYHDGTSRIFDDANFHYFTVAPAYELHLGGGTDYGVYAQLGGGFAYQFSALHADGAESTISGVKPVLQYGVGFRARPTLLQQPNLRLALRLELTRFRRGYMDDTLAAASVGANF